MAGGAEDNDEIRALRELIGRSKRIVALTGAGISTESGIPDFRSPGGLWSRMRPITYQEFVASEEARMEEWRRRFRANERFATAEPNEGHLGLVRLMRAGKLLAVITQNIDGLHQRAGLSSESVVEIHGTSMRAHCLDCRTPMTLQTIRATINATGASPRCECGGLIKAAIVSFGERIPEEALAKATALSQQVDLFLVVGSSLLVQPAASLPLVAKRAGAALAIINREATPFDEYADLTLGGSIGAVFSTLYPQAVDEGARRNGE
jgi:NAD-dependent protein deacetylase/lipoamidase